MELREHPLMTHGGAQSWPPVWIQTRPAGVIKRYGEIGVLTYVRGGASTKCFLVIDHENQSYLGTLILDDLPFCAQVAKLLEEQIGKRIVHIGSLDISATL